MVEGACPQCGVVGEDQGVPPAEVQPELSEKSGIPASHPTSGLQFAHLPGCPLEMSATSPDLWWLAIA